MNILLLLFARIYLLLHHLLAYYSSYSSRHCPDGASPLSAFLREMFMLALMVVRGIVTHAFQMVKKSFSKTVRLFPFAVLVSLFAGLFVSISSVQALIISEIMYDPAGDDSKYEFIELYAENHTDVSGYSFEGLSFTFPQNYGFSGFIVIASSAEGFAERYHSSPHFQYTGSLRNTGELIAIRANGSQSRIFAANYTDTARPGYSLEWTSQGYIEGIMGGTPAEDFAHISSEISAEDDSSSESSGSPESFPTSVPLAESPISLLPPSSPSLSSSSSQLPNSSGSSSSQSSSLEKRSGVRSSSSSPLSPSSPTVACAPTLSFVLDKSNYTKGDTVVFTPLITGMPEKSSFELRYHIEDSLGNTAKSELVTQNKEPKQYTPRTIRRRETFSIVATLRVPCTTRSVQSRTSFLVLSNDSFSFELGKLPATIHYGDVLAVPLMIFPNSSVSSDLRIAVPELVNLSFAVSDFMNMTLRIQIPDRCDSYQLSFHTNISLEYAGKKIEKELLLLPSQSCNLPRLRNVYSRVQNFTVGKNITVFVSFESRDIRESDTVSLFNGDIRYSKDLKNELSPLEFPIVLARGNNTVEVELRRRDQVIDRAVADFSIPLLSSRDGAVGTTLDSALDSDSHDEIFKKELSVSSSRSLARALPQIPKLYYLLFGISVFGNVLFLWKS